MPQQDSSSSKKRKHPETPEDATHSMTKKMKKDGKDKSKKRDKKGKSRQDITEGEFVVISASVSLSIPPRFAMSPMSGALEMLDSLIMRHVPALQGVMLGHSNVRFLSHTALIKNECPFAICDVGFDATVWSPQVGMKLKGKINLCSPDHISLLIHQTFNISIPRHHIPTDEWEFEYGAAENDPEFGPHATHGEKTDMEESNSMDVDGDAVVSTEDEGGIWIHKVTRDRIGGRDGLLELTVIGLTVANQMLSLTGSIQPDPFSPKHAPQATVNSRPKTIEEGVHRAEEKEELIENVVVENDSSDEDPFAALGRAQDEAAEVDKAKKAQEKLKSKEDGKRKKKEKKVGLIEDSAVHSAAEEAKKPSKKKRKIKAE